MSFKGYYSGHGSHAARNKKTESDLREFRLVIDKIKKL